MKKFKNGGLTILFLLVAQFILLTFHSQFHFQDVWENTVYYWQRYLFGVLVLFVFYLCGLVVFNRQKYAWFSFFSMVMLFAFADYLKISYRSEPLLPSDFTQIFEITSIIKMLNEIHVMVLFVILGLLVGAFLLVTKIKSNVIFTTKQRIGSAFILMLIIMSMYYSNHPFSPFRVMASAFGITDVYWDLTEDYSSNGPIVGFIKNLDIQVMGEQPENYSYEAVRKIVNEYKEKAKAGNDGKDSLKNHIVIFILSESFVDPLRIPSLQLSDDPIPYIRSLKNETTSGVMLGSGYGGGTANVEYEVLTGFSTTYFDSSLTIPYTLLVPNLKEAPNLTNVFSQKTAVHTYNAGLYRRKEVFEKFGFDRFYYDGGDLDLSYKEMVDNSEYISDKSAYQEVLDIVKDQEDNNLFMLLTTMQNHLPYKEGQYSNQFQVLNELDEQKKSAIETYVQGIHYTDGETENFIEEINQIDKPITVFFFGDHLPSEIFESFDESKHENLAFYQTDYFVYSNFETPALDYSIVSPNVMSSIVLEQLNVTLTPYYVMLDEVKKTVPVIRWGEYLVQSDGEFVTEDELSEDAQKLVNMYRMIQYDINEGEQYSIELGMFEFEQ
ncbi:LTA synthase family protein [Solibacillus daqui]|uniref:LTA synthase family protein n=1 Tax=Solibacillus daqui TaxID=2912187 RepID=UPI002366E964|nr:LTA synthase family protein [Solibacillus daqui]